MSTINKKPFIKTLLEDFSREQLSILSQLIDGGGNQNALLRTMSNKPVGNRTNITADDKGIHLCSLELEFSLFKGYLLYSDHYCVLIHFTDSQILGMFNINVAERNLATVSEYLDVEELRTTLSDLIYDGAVVDVTAANIKSGSEPSGKVLTTNGTGGAIWTDRVDKDILSKCKIFFDSESEPANTVICFPKNVLPLFFGIFGEISDTLYNLINGNLLYLDYTNGQLIDENGDVLPGDMMRCSFGIFDLGEEFEDYNAFIILRGNVVDDIREAFSQPYTEMAYMGIEGTGLGVLPNAWYIWNPITSSGTKLYKHTIVYTDGPATGGDEFISTISNDFSTYTPPSSNVFVAFSKTNAYSIRCISITYNGSNYSLKFEQRDLSTDEISTGTITSDTVTEL